MNFQTVPVVEQGSDLDEVQGNKKCDQARRIQ